MMLLLLFAGLLLGTAVFLAAEAATLPARRRSELVERAATYGRPVAGASPAAGLRRPGVKRHGPIAGAIGGFVLKFMPRKTRQTLEKRLLSAGLADRFSPETILAAKGVLTILAILVGFLLGSRAAPATGLLLGLCFGFLGFLLPDVFVNSKIRDRQERVLAALPDALDLLAVSVEAGLGFDGAVAKLVDYMDGPLIDEFALTLNEMRIGESRTEALKRMAARVDVPELGTFIRAVVQADQLGTSIAGILRVQAADARLRRQFAAEEKAMKAPIKMLVPTAIFIFPALFIVILGPILMNFHNL
jgi:tight adherence protein C